VDDFQSLHRFWTDSTSRGVAQYICPHANHAKPSYLPPHPDKTSIVFPSFLRGSLEDVVSTPIPQLSYALNHFRTNSKPHSLGDMYLDPHFLETASQMTVQFSTSLSALCLKRIFGSPCTATLTSHLSHIQCGERQMPGRACTAASLLQV
jgi:hypothetical protein